MTRREATSRREFLRRLAAGTLGWGLANLPENTGQAAGDAGRPFFRTRGVVLTPADLRFKGWPELAHRAGLTTVSLHHPNSPKAVVQWRQSPDGQRFLEQCRRLGLRVEYELHAMRELLPRELFQQDPSLFRMTANGERKADSNLCPHSEQALAIVAERAVALAQALQPTTQRYFFWGDDGEPWCHCRRCRDLTDAEQALLVENRVAAALQKQEPQAQLAHLAYSNTLAPPRQIKPARGVFLEYAPIQRRYDVPYAAQTDTASPDRLEMLDGNLAVFGADRAQVLEYWLDVSRFSHYRKPPVKLPWNPQAFSADLQTYGRRGIRNITSFAVFMDADYFATYGESPIVDYGRRLLAWPHK